MSDSSAEDRVGKRLKFRDLQVFFAVAKAGGMAKAARQLGLTQPAVSEIIAQLEQLFGVRLFDRSTRGVESTAYGRALLKRAQAALDEMKQGVRDIAFLADPTSGEVRVGCPARLSAAILPQIIHRFSQIYPRVILHVDEIAPLTSEASGLLREPLGLRDRKYDLVFGRLAAPFAQNSIADDVNVETLFADQPVVAAGIHNRWTRRRKIDLAELIDERWILTAPDTWNYLGVAEAFRIRGLPMPKASLITSSVHVVTHLLAKDEFITVTSKLIAGSLSLKVLPIDLPVVPWPAVILTLKNRTLSPVVERFIECAREVVKSIASVPKSRVRNKPNVA